MAFPVVATLQVLSQNSQTFTPSFTMPATVNAGDLLLVLLTSDESNYLHAPSGWTEIDPSGARVVTFAYARVADGSEDSASYQWEAEDNAARFYGWLLRITGWGGNIGADIAISSIAFGDDDTPDAANLSGGSAEDRLWITFYGMSGSGGTVDEYPTNFTDNQQTGNSGTSTPTSAGGIATRNLNASSLNPGPFLANISDEWEARTLYIRPSTSSPVTESMATPTASAASLAALGKIACLMGKMAADAISPVLDYTNEAPGAVTEAMGKMTASAEHYANIVSIDEEEIFFNRDNIKVYYYKVYDHNGDFVCQWPSTGIPEWSWPINGRQSSLMYDLPRRYGQAGELGELNDLVKDLQLGYTINSVVVDREQPYGIVIHSGRIEEYEITDPASDDVVITIVPNASNFMDNFVFGPIEFVNTDPSEMFEYFVDNGYMPGLTWSASNVLVGQKFTVTFEKQRISDIVEQIRQMAGSNWFWRVDSDNTIIFKKWNLKAATHSISGANIAQVRYVRSRMETKTRVFVFGAEARDEFGFLLDRIHAVATGLEYDPNDPRDMFYSDSRITDNSNAQRIAHSLLEFHQNEQIETEIEIVDSNQDPEHGYDIETIKPGDTLEIFNPNATYNRTRWGDFDWGEEPWGNEYAGLVQGPLVVANVDYVGSSLRVKLTNKPAAFVEELIKLDNRILLEGST